MPAPVISGAGIFDVLAPGVKRRFFAIEKIFAENGIFPPHRIVKRVGSCIAPVAVEPVFGKGGTCPRELEQFVRRGDGDFRR